MTALPKPPHWANVRGRAFTAYLSLLIAALLVWSLVRLVSGAGVGIAQVTVPLWAAAVAVAAYLARRGSGQRIRCDQYGTTLLPNNASNNVILFGLLGLFALGLVYAVLILIGVDLPGLFSSRRSGVAQDAVLAGGVGIVMIPALLWAWRRNAGNFLNLNPIGFHANEKPVKSARWDDVMDVVDFIPWADPSVEKLWPPPMTPIVFVMRDRSLLVVPSGETYATNGSAVFWMVRNYWLHPEQRGELLNGIALDRLTREQFPTA